MVVYGRELNFESSKELQKSICLKNYFDNMKYLPFRKQLVILVLKLSACRLLTCIDLLVLLKLPLVAVRRVEKVTKRKGRFPSGNPKEVVCC